MDLIEKYERKESYYDVLGCTETSTLAQITTEFRILAKKCHPDKNSNDNDDVTNEKDFEKLQHAYEVLKSEESRKQYDTWLHSGLCIPFESWNKMSEQSHVSMHWGRKKKELAIESADKKDDLTSASNQKSTKTTHNENTDVSTANVQRNFKRHQFDNTSGRNKFRKYQL
ncbi:dnaJ homolog subfamily C member 12-like [Hydractinia symbiolongicarpus]|uniref:dnaJ homolog subfamily C member 12-like n=1 Tax=Hydractinia symbiolongicarpus TaxID=13093 RepID=UPI002550166C|nr:dnaJ homolog subfamily C member 12-like [Hydractinia symbiolongicarpus]